MTGEIVDREEVRDAVAKAFATIAQTLRAIPDNLERQMGITPEVAEKIGLYIDEAMGELARDLKAQHDSLLELPDEIETPEDEFDFDA